MFEAQYLLEGDRVCGPWMSRWADNIKITLDIIENSDAVNNDVVVELYHKNTEDTVATGVAGGVIQGAAAGQWSVTASGLKELVRYRFTYAEESSGGAYALIRMLPPAWFDSVGA